MNKNNETTLDISAIQSAFASFERALRIYEKIDRRVSPLAEADELEWPPALILQ
jgi:hypothetical protein